MLAFARVKDSFFLNEISKNRKLLFFYNLEKVHTLILPLS